MRKTRAEIQPLQKWRDLVKRPIAIGILVDAYEIFPRLHIRDAREGLAAYRIRSAKNDPFPPPSIQQEKDTDDTAPPTFVLDDQNSGRSAAQPLGGMPLNQS
jgi:hypothetical protein